MKRIGSSDFVFETTGRQSYAFCGVIGIEDDEREEGDLARLKTSEGSDGTFHQYEPELLTVEERHELADYMIGLWTRYKNAA